MTKRTKKVGVTYVSRFPAATACLHEQLLTWCAAASTVLGRSLQQTRPAHLSRHRTRARLATSPKRWHFIPVAELSRDGGGEETPV